MSYLNPLRLHFAGRFQANISTVNNDPAHFDNATFVLPDYQELNGPGFNPPNGWFNPQGDATWRLRGCTVTAAWLPTGAVAADDPVLKMIVADSNTQAPGKLVDLDSEQQLVSEIWGLQVRIADASGNDLLVSDFEPAAFNDIWDRAIGTGGAGGDVDASAMYQSVLTNLQWGDVSGSTFLGKLQTAASNGTLSIKFNVDNINFDNTSADFMTGRIVGTIGPSTSDWSAFTEPQHMVIGRQFMAAPAPAPQPPANPPSFFAPAGGINFCAAVVDTKTSCIFLDLGNALNTSVADGTMIDIGDLYLGYYDPILSPTNPAGSVIPLGTIPATGTGGYTSATWYATTAGIVVLPLTADQLTAVAVAPLVLSSTKGNFISEWTSGTFVRADTFVYRLSPGDAANPSVQQINVYATQWGQPLAGATIDFVLDPTQLQMQASSQLIPNPPQPGTPTNVLTFNRSAPTDGNGIAVLNLTVTDPGTPRWFNGGYGMDGQVYGIRASLSGSQYAGPVNQWNFISILLWSGFTASDPVTWTDVEPIFTQYANLYPVMNRFLNLADYGSVVANAGLLLLAFNLKEGNPNVMPVTRDLSPAKRAAIVSFLAKPLPAVQAKAAPEAAARTAPAPAVGAELARRGGKAAAAARRVAAPSSTKGAQS